MSAHLALSDAAASERGRVRYIDFKERRWVPGFMFLVDVAAVESALLFGYLGRNALSSWWPITLTPSIYLGLIVGVLVVPVSYYAIGLHPGYGMGSIERLRRHMRMTVFVFGMLIAWDYIAQGGDWSRGVMLATFAFVLVLSPLFETLGRGYLIRKGLWGVPVLLAGTGEKGALLARILRDEPGLGFVPIGFLTQDSGDGITELENLPVLGHVSQAVALKAQVETVILTAPGDSPNGFGQLIKDLPFRRVIVVPNLSEFPSLWVNARDLGGVLVLELRQNLLIRRNQVLKEISDYVLAIPLFLVSLPILAAAAVCIKIMSPGPAFFQQERDGLDGRKFRMWKLRTMCPDAEARLEEYLRKNPGARKEWQTHMKLRNDPRVIPRVGVWLRATSIDELPQFWNVLRGEMSLVGPRPFPRYHLDMFTAEFRDFRTGVRPGITGLWQVTARSEADLKAQEVLDTYYIRNWSLWLDLYTLVRTIPAVLGRNGAR